MDPSLLFGLAITCLVGFNTWHVLKLRGELGQLGPALGGAFQSLQAQLEQIADLPEVLKGVGGVQLMPQKSFGEIMVEHLTNHFFGGKEDQPLSDADPDAQAWPPVESEPSLVEGSSKVSE